MDGLLNEGSILSPELSDLRSLIASLRKRLKSINISEIAQPSPQGTTPIPVDDMAAKLDMSFTALLDEVNTLPESIPESFVVDTELRTLRSEVRSTSDLLRRVHHLAAFASSIQRCDNALSDLLEHIDSYPAPPSGLLSSNHNTDTRLPPEDQMSARIAFTRELVEDITLRAIDLSDDPRIAPEKERVCQTWEELQAMGLDRIIGHKSRPASAISNGRVSRNAPTPAPPPVSGPKRLGGRPSISRPSSTSKFLVPPPRARRSSSANSSGGHSRSSSRASNASTQRSVSGPITIPLTNPNSRLYSSTFASRQRSNSVTSDVSTPTGKRGTPTLPPLPPTPQTVNTRPRARTNQNMPGRVASPTLSEVPRSRSSLNMSRSSVSSVSKSTWSRAPRQSFPNVRKSPSPAPKPGTNERRPYVPNPKNKLDVAVGDVVNKLPVNISIEVVADTWKDQSGKYWIGDEDPKLCFCRILRSQTVMVRVGGGWTELSKYVQLPRLRSNANSWGHIGSSGNILLTRFDYCQNLLAWMHRRRSGSVRPFCNKLQYRKSC